MDVSRPPLERTRHERRPLAFPLALAVHGAFLIGVIVLAFTIGGVVTVGPVFRVAGSDGIEVQCVALIQDGSSLSPGLGMTVAESKALAAYMDRMTKRGTFESDSSGTYRKNYETSASVALTRGCDEARTQRQTTLALLLAIALATLLVWQRSAPRLTRPTRPEVSVPSD